MPVFDLPSLLHPVRESDDCIRVPNIAVGKVSIDGSLVPVYSAFFSHVCMLDKDQWSLIEVPTQHVEGAELSVEAVADELAELSVEAKGTIKIFVDPITLNVFKGCVWNFYSGDRDDVAFLRVRVEEKDARTAWYDVGTAYGSAIEKLKKSVTAGKEPPSEPVKKTEILESGTASKTQECVPSKASPSSSETAVEA